MSNTPIVLHADMGLQDTLGYVTYIHADRTELHLDVNESHLNRAGFLHGGIFCVLLDSACGYAASRHLSKDASQMVVTLSLTTNYLAPAGKGLVRAIGRVTGGGATTVFTEGHIVDRDDNILVTCTALMRRVGKRL